MIRRPGRRGLADCLRGAGSCSPADPTVGSPAIAGSYKGSVRDLWSGDSETMAHERRGVLTSRRPTIRPTVAASNAKRQPRNSRKGTKKWRPCRGTGRGAVACPGFFSCSFVSFVVASSAPNPPPRKARSVTGCGRLPGRYRGYTSASPGRPGPGRSDDLARPCGAWATAPHASGA